MVDAHRRRFNGITFGTGSYIIEEEEGVDGFQVVDASAADPLGDGDLPGDMYLEARVITLRGWVNAPTIDAAEAALATLKAATTRRVNGSLPYEFRHAGQPEQMVRARIIDRRIARSVETEAIGRPEFRIALKADDPRIYSITQHTAPLPLFAVGNNGINFPLNFPLNFPAPSGTYAFIANAGDALAYPRIDVDFLSGGSDDFDGITLTNITTGQELTIDLTALETPAPMTAGQRLTLDFDAYIRRTGGFTVSVSGSSRLGAWQHPREPFTLAPGSNTIKLEILGSTPTTDVDALITWRDTSI